ncbi:hypothetical protein C2G38_2062823 [Gigaspora rosea]|uniref:Uncharacterized protein n=1 Tax=Gigaspora rosea TaxID=44941 RepID=A0A397VX42_9GLOM|nr:hypothetical protein C2G38_2062823 [Gigaspora rosea]
MATCKMFLSISAFNLYCLHLHSRSIRIFLSSFSMPLFFSTDYVHVQNVILALYQFCKSFVFICDHFFLISLIEIRLQHSY